MNEEADNLFIVQHTNPLTEDVKLIGVFSDRMKAVKAIEQLSQQAGFSESIDGFHIDSIQLNHVAWSEGFH